jgi:hypothetical protein
VVWLIESLTEQDVLVRPSKIERLQQVGLAPRPLTHRSDDLAGAELWPDGVLGHYAAVVPLVRQRHSATELAALTMIGWGYPVDIELLRRSYARAFNTLFEPEELRDAMLTHYQNKGMPLVKAGIAHLRSHGDYPKDTTAEELGYDFLDSLTGLSSGKATKEQLRVLLLSVFPKSADAPEQVVEFVLTCYDRVQADMSLTAMLSTALTADLSDFMEAQPIVAKDVKADLERFGGVDFACTLCNETLGLLTGTALPCQIRMSQLDLESLLPDSLLDMLKE